MNEIKINELEVNSYFSEPVYLDSNYILITPEIPINNKLVEALKMSGYKKVYTDGKKTTNPSYLEASTSANIENLTKNQVVSNSMTTEDIDQRELALKDYVNALKFFSRIFKHFSQTEELNAESITTKVKEMQKMYQKDKETFLYLPDIKTDNYLIVDAVKSTFLTLALVDVLRYPQHRQIEVAIAALLHDIGMLRIRNNLYLHNRKLSPEEIKEIRSHITIGARAIQKAGFSKEIIQAVQDHHENFDGTGYPFQSAGATISGYGKILGIICAYTAATSKRLFRSRKGNHFGIIDILQQTNKLYDPVITKAFVLMLSIYPLGCFVELQDGRKGIVVKTSMQDPQHPTIKIMIEENGKPSPHFSEISTATEGCNISRALNEEEILSLKNIFRFNSLLSAKSNPNNQ